MKKRASIKYSLMISVAILCLVTISCAALDLLSGRGLWLFKYELYIVHGASMEPAIAAGSIILVQRIAPAQLGVGDIVTFKTPAETESGNCGSQRVTTHRIITVHDRVASPSFITKGDANENTDRGIIDAADLVGKVALSVPYAGYVVHFYRSCSGLIFLIIIPGAGLIAMEVRQFGQCQEPCSAVPKKQHP